MYPVGHHDEFGRGADTPLPPERIARLVAKENEALDNEFGERRGAGGEVHVQSHARDGGKIEVSDYWRARPGKGSGSERSPESSKVRNLLDDAENAGDENDAGDSKPGNSLPAPGSREPVDPEDFYRKAEFDPNGESEWQAFRRRPVDAVRAGIERNRADDTTEKEYPGGDHHNNEADAFRHAYWSFETTRRIGPEAAKEFGDAHERSDPNPTPERLMDLYNNKAGRDLATDPANADRDGREVIREAIHDGKLRTRPFETNEPHSPLPDRAPGLLFRPSDSQRR